MLHIKTKKYRPFLASICFVIFISLAFLVKTKATLITQIDSTIQKALMPYTTPPMTSFVEKLTFLGGPEMAFVFSLLLCLFIYLKHDLTDATWALVTAIICNLINYLVKHLVARPRPSDKLVAVGGYSFPSGHTFGTALFVFLALHFLLPHLKRISIKILWIFLGGFWILVIALTRIYLHVHYPTDTMASFFLVSFLFESSLMLYATIQKKYLSSTTTD